MLYQDADVSANNILKDINIPLTWKPNRCRSGVARSQRSPSEKGSLPCISDPNDASHAGEAQALVPSPPLSHHRRPGGAYR
jgi:hypothetical protein